MLELNNNHQLASDDSTLIKEALDIYNAIKNEDLMQFNFYIDEIINKLRVKDPKYLSTLKSIDIKECIKDDYFIDEGNDSSIFKHFFIIFFMTQLEVKSSLFDETKPSNLYDDGKHFFTKPDMFELDLEYVGHHPTNFKNKKPFIPELID